MSIDKINGLNRIVGAERNNTISSPSEQIKPERNQRVDEVAKMYEKQFLREMVKAMRGTVSASEMTKPSMGEEIYRGQLDEQYVENWGDTGGLGLADVIYDELMEKYVGPSMRQPLPKGPLSLTNRDIARVQKLPQEAGMVKQAPMKVEVRPSADGQPAKIQTPWDAVVLAKTKVDGRTTVLLEHPSGHRSAFIFDGVAIDHQPGQKIPKGAPIGILNPAAKSFLWNLNGKGHT